jgi:hypothetical protein
VELLTPSRLIAKADYAAGIGFGVEQLQPDLLVEFTEQGFAVAQNYRVDVKTIVVNQIQLNETLGSAGAAQQPAQRRKMMCPRESIFLMKPVR